MGSLSSLGIALVVMVLTTLALGMLVVGITFTAAELAFVLVKRSFILLVTLVEDVSFVLASLGRTFRIRDLPLPDFMPATLFTPLVAVFVVAALAEETVLMVIEPAGLVLDTAGLGVFTTSNGWVVSGLAETVALEILMGVTVGLVGIFPTVVATQGALVEALVLAAF